MEAIGELAASGCPILATCAGAILLSRRITNPGRPGMGLLDVTTERGDISVIGAGGSPTGDFADVASLDCRSTLGNVKVEVNGDGINAPYSVASDRGTETVEIDGKASPLTGQLGDNPGSGRNYVRLRSSAGDVQLSLMAKPY